MAFLVSWNNNFELFSALARTDWVIPIQLIGNKPLRHRGVFLPHSNSYVIQQEEEQVFSKLTVFTKYHICPFTIGGDLDFIYLGKGVYLGGYGSTTEKSAHQWIENTCNCKIISVFTNTSLSDIAVKCKDTLVVQENTLSEDVLALCNTLINLTVVPSDTTLNFIVTTGNIIINGDDLSNPIEQIADYFGLNIIEVPTQDINKQYINYIPDSNQTVT